MKYVHLFETASEFEEAYNGSGYTEPWVSYTQQNSTVNYNKRSHDFVDLGLTSGNLWSTTNVGADAPEDFGNYYAWGEIEEKTTYNWTTYKLCNGSYNTLTKYNTSGSYGTVDNKEVLDSDDDVASVEWGDGWRMPTYDDFEELLNETDNTWETLNGVYGRRFTSKTDSTKSIFIPAAGLQWGEDEPVESGEGEWGAVWSASLGDYPTYAWDLDFASDGCDSGSSDRAHGYPVRPVLSQD